MQSQPKERRPVDFHPDLTDDRLAALARLIVSVRGGSVDNYVPDEGERRCSLGIRFLERLPFAMLKAEAENPDYAWLHVTDTSLHLRWTLGSVPMGLYRGRPTSPRRRALLRRYPEIHQMRLAFGTEGADYRWRLAVQTNALERVEKIWLVRATEHGEALDRWELPLSSAAKAKDEKVAKPRQLRPGVPIERPKVGTRRPRKKTSEGEGDGGA